MEAHLQGEVSWLFQEERIGGGGEGDELSHAKRREASWVADTVGNEQRRGRKKKKMQKKRDFLGVGICIDICLNFFTILLGFAPFRFPTSLSLSPSFLLCVFFSPFVGFLGMNSSSRRQEQQQQHSSLFFLFAS